MLSTNSSHGNLRMSEFLLIIFGYFSAYSDEGQVCTPSGTVAAAIVTVILLHLALVGGFTYFYRRKRRSWMNKDLNPLSFHNPAGLPAYSTNPRNSLHHYTSPDIMFRNVYDHHTPGLNNPTFPNVSAMIPTPNYSKDPDHEKIKNTFTRSSSVST